ncbi:uncharacterized protein LOC108962386 isoform X2 [Serinus canaria]|uniref:uncharacterized protein LOC108962386 isoform X2 n=1 Tax=Serinus canaria TaxID=9135 RepID=UPI0021CCCE72|nr:uncharacterized protein LOC108962386 isoform X2 [Serinus canaria]
MRRRAPDAEVCWRERVPGAEPGPSRAAAPAVPGPASPRRAIQYLSLVLVAASAVCRGQAGCARSGALPGGRAALGGSGAVQGEDRDLFPLGSAWREVWRAPRATLGLLFVFLACRCSSSVPSVRTKAVYVFDVLRVLLACGEHQQLREDAGLWAGRSREKAGRAGPVLWDLQEECLWLQTTMCTDQHQGCPLAKLSEDKAELLRQHS